MLSYRVTNDFIRNFAPDETSTNHRLFPVELLMVVAKLGMEGGIMDPKKLKIQTARSPRPEGVRWRPIACWKAILM